MRVLSLRQLLTRAAAATRLSFALPKYKTRLFTNTHVRAFAVPTEPASPFNVPEEVVKALKDSPVFATLSSNTELQGLLLETYQVLKDEGMSHYSFHTDLQSCSMLLGIDPVNPSMFTLLKSAKVREQMKKLGVAFTDAGLDLTKLRVRHFPIPRQYIPISDELRHRSCRKKSRVLTESWKRRRASEASLFARCWIVGSHIVRTPSAQCHTETFLSWQVPTRLAGRVFSYS